MEPITEFSGEFAFLSNFHPSRVAAKELVFPTVEHAFQAAKTPDPVWAARIQFAPTPGAAKRFGRQCPLREDWNEIKDDVMLEFVRLKFLQNPPLAQALLATGTRTLVEGNTWGDTYWGQVDGVGQNRLGAILMRVRSEIMWVLEPEHATVSSSQVPM